MLPHTFFTTSLATRAFSRRFLFLFVLALAVVAFKPNLMRWSSVAFSLRHERIPIVTDTTTPTNCAALASHDARDLRMYAFPVSAASSLFVPGVAPNGDPGGFDIEGDLRANTPTANTSDWTPGVSGSGVGVLTAAGVPVNAVKTFHAVDLYDSQQDNIFTGGLKYPDNPNTWNWTTSTSSR